MTQSTLIHSDQRRQINPRRLIMSIWDFSPGSREKMIMVLQKSWIPLAAVSFGGFLYAKKMHKREVEELQAKVESLETEMSSMGDQKQRLEEIYFKELEEHSVIVNEQEQFLEAEKTKTSRLENELQEKENYIRTLTEEIEELKIEINRIQVEKNSSKVRDNWKKLFRESKSGVRR